MSDSSSSELVFNQTDSASFLSVWVNIFLDPTKAFAQIWQKGHAWFPIVLLGVLSVGLLYWYFQTVDMAWLIDQLLSAQKDMRDSEKQAITQILNRETMMWGSLIGGALGTLIGAALMALYYLIASKITHIPIEYGKWFSFNAWLAMPNLMAMILMAYQIYSSDGRLTVEELNMLSLNSLVTHFPTHHPWASLMNLISIPMMGSIVLSVIGLRVWTDKPLRTCITISILPSAIISLGFVSKALLSH